MELDTFVQVTKAVAEPTRARILKMLEAGELCVCDITERTGLAQSTVSKHLAVLRQAGLVQDRKEGLWVYYSLPTEPANDLSRAMLGFLRKHLPTEPSTAGNGDCCGA